MANLKDKIGNKIGEKMSNKSGNQKSANNSGNPLSNGFKYANNYKKSTTNGKDEQNSLKNKINAIKQKKKKETAKKAITKAASSVGPVGTIAAKAALNTPKGNQYLDAYASADSEAQGISNVKRLIKKDVRKVTIIGTALAIALPLIFLIILIAALDKNADSQIYSNKNGGTVNSEYYIRDDKKVNVFANYPGLYEEIERVTEKVSKEYKVEIDKYLIISTLIHKD